MDGELRVAGAATGDRPFPQRERVLDQHRAHVIARSRETRKLPTIKKNAFSSTEGRKRCLPDSPCGPAGVELTGFSR